MELELQNIEIVSTEKVEKNSTKNTDESLPTLQIFSACLPQVCEAINVNVLFPFMAFFVEDLGHGGAELGFYSGILAASFCGAQFLTSMFWGLISDRIGRKSAIIIGTIGAAVGMLIFGSAKTYFQAVLGRVLGGLLSGNIGVLKCFVTEITNNSNRGKGFSYLQASWSIGSIFAPLIGGFLSKPKTNLTLFNEYPYLLPAVVCAGLNLISALVCLMLMKESKTPNSNSTSTYSALETEENYPTSTPNTPITDIESDPSELSVEDQVEVEVGGKEEWLSKEVWWVTLQYGLISACFILFDETLPLFLKESESSGGFGFTSMEIGILLCVSAMVTFIFMVVYMPMVNAHSKFLLFNVGVKTAVVTVISWPLIELFCQILKSFIKNELIIYVLEWGFLLTLSIVYNVVCYLAYVSILVLVNNSVSTKHIGAVNGLGQSLASFARALGPVVGGFLWSVSVSCNFIFTNFLCVGFLLLVTLKIMDFIPKNFDTTTEK